MGTFVPSPPPIGGLCGRHLAVYIPRVPKKVVEAPVGPRRRLSNEAVRPVARSLISPPGVAIDQAS